MNENIQNKSKRNILIEILRLYFIICITFWHLIGVRPDIVPFLQSIFKIESYNTGFCGDFFLILGGFFLYKIFEKGIAPFNIIKKYYKRLIIPFLFVFLLCDIFGGVNTQILSTLTLTFCTITTGVEHQVTGWGDWYVSVYFWSVCLYVGIFATLKKEKAMIATCFIVFIAFCMIHSIPRPPFMGECFMFINFEFLRGIANVGLGLSAAYLGNFLPKVDKNIISTIFFGIIELITLVYITKFIWYNAYYSEFHTQIVFAILLIISTFYQGFITKIFNKFNFILPVSKFAYPIFVCQIFIMRAFFTDSLIPQVTSLSTEKIILCFFTATFLLAIIEYYLFEKIIIKYIGKFFKKYIAVKENNFDV